VLRFRSDHQMVYVKPTSTIMIEAIVVGHYRMRWFYFKVFFTR